MKILWQKYIGIIQQNKVGFRNVSNCTQIPFEHMGAKLN